MKTGSTLSEAKGTILPTYTNKGKKSQIGEKEKGPKVGFPSPFSYHGSQLIGIHCFLFCPIFDSTDWRQSKILILDEATAFLDKTAEEGIKQTLKNLMKNKTIILVSHRKTAISHAHHLVVLGNEGLIFQGRPQEFIHDA